MPIEQQLPEWNAVGTEPPQSLKDSGWEATQKPPAEYFNWQMNLTFLALQELQQVVSNHENNTNNPHNTNWSNLQNKPTAFNPTNHGPKHATGGSDPIEPGDIGAEPAFTKNTAFNKDFGTTSGTVAEGDHTHSEYATNTDLSNHTGDRTNPHGVTPSQIGAEQSFTKNTAFNKDFGTTAGTVAEGNHTHAEYATDTDLSNHTGDTANPHNVTASQVGLGNLTNDQQATKAEFDTHQANEVAHRTQAEKDKLAGIEANANNYSHPSTHPDTMIDVTDANSNFTATKLDGVLDELFTFADNGKTNIASVVGSPATASDTFSQLQTIIQNQKNTLATNLSNKEVSASGSESLKALADKVANIEVGDYSYGDKVPAVKLYHQLYNAIHITDFGHWVVASVLDSNNNIIAGSYSGYVKKFDSQGNLIWSFGGHSGSYVYDLAIDSYGNIFSASQDSTLRKIDSNGNEVWLYSYSSYGIKAVDIGPDNYIYIGDENNNLKKIDQSGNEVWTFNGHAAYVLAVAVDKGNNYIYTGSSDDTLKKIDSNGNEIWTFSGHTDQVKAVAVDQTYGYIYSASTDNTVRKITPSGNEHWSFSDSDYYYCLTVATNGTVYCGARDYMVRKLNEEGSSMWTHDLSGRVHTVSVNDEGQFYAGITNNRITKVEDSYTLKE